MSTAWALNYGCRAAAPPAFASLGSLSYNVVRLEVGGCHVTRTRGATISTAWDEGPITHGRMAT